MQRAKVYSRGFTLVASLMLLLLMSGMAIGLLMMVNTENNVGSHDLRNNLAYHAAEGAIEKQTSDLANLFQNIESPGVAEIEALGTSLPASSGGITYPDYTLTPSTNADGSLASSYGQIQSGPYAGLYALIMPVTLNATAQEPLGDEVSMSRQVEVALIPVFQFGVFFDGDLGFFSSPTLDFAGRVHTNSDLYVGVANAYTLTFHQQISAWGNVITKVLPNGVDATNSGNNDQGTVYVLSASGGCDNQSRLPSGTCKVFSQSMGSVTGGPTSGQNSNWPTVSQTTFQYNIIDGNWGNAGGTGATDLSLPFVNGTTQPFQIIRRPPVNESPASVLGGSRLGNQAQIRVLLSDNEADLHLSDWNGDASQDVELASLVPAGLLAGGAGWAQNGITVGGSTYYFGEANTNCAGGLGCDANFVTPPYFHGAAFPGGIKEWPMIDGWLLVEVKQADGNWHGVTQQWLQQGFARGLAVPNSETGTVNSVHPNAILIFQQQADRNDDGKLTNAGDVSITTTGANSQYNWFPINIYDPREGEPWDVSQTGANVSSCTPNGVMNATELDVGNLRKWLKGTIGTTGNQVDYIAQNGYILYFSDRRGMQYPPGQNTLVGEYGFEDTINLANNGMPDGRLEPIPAGKTQSPEDVNGDGSLTNYGVAHVGDAFGPTFQTATNTTNPPNPYNPRIANCATTARKNRVTGARHILKLVDGTLGNLPTRGDNNAGGFTVTSENPVYIQADYNTNSTDKTWTDSNASDPAHSAAAVIADAVTLLSNSWSDPGSFSSPTSSTAQSGATTYYRTAIASGKTLSFNNPNGNPTEFFGTDGGLHNFLRFLEDWSNATLYYKGSLVSLYDSTYATGTFKCCNTVYNPPTRNYVFDPEFELPQNLPPGTPMFRDVDNLSYRQTVTQRTY